MATENATKILEIAKAAGVSTATVSRVFNRHPYVSDEIRQKVLYWAHELNYAPAISSSRYIIGIMMHDAGNGIAFNSYYNQLLHSLSHELFKLHFNTQIFGANQLPYLHQNTFRGIIMLTTSHLETVRDSGIPLLLINNVVPGVRSVVTDHKASLELATRHLIDNCHKKIALVRCDNWGSQQRELGYRAELERAGIPFSHDNIGIYRTLDEVHKTVERLICTVKPTAIVAEGESVAIPLNSALFKMNIRVPEELSVITFEDICNSKYMTPPHTTISQNFTQLGKIAAKMIVDIAGSARKQSAIKELTVLNCNQLIERESVLTLTRS